MGPKSDCVKLSKTGIEDFFPGPSLLITGGYN